MTQPTHRLQGVARALAVALCVSVLLSAVAPAVQAQSVGDLLGGTHALVSGVAWVIVRHPVQTAVFCAALPVGLVLATVELAHPPRPPRRTTTTIVSATRQGGVR